MILILPSVKNTQTYIQITGLLISFQQYSIEIIEQIKVKNCASKSELLFKNSQEKPEISKQFDKKNYRLNY